MTEGEVVQTGTAQELFETPRAHLRRALRRQPRDELALVQHRGRRRPAGAGAGSAARRARARRSRVCPARSSWASVPSSSSCSPSPIEGGHPVELLSVRPHGQRTRWCSARLEDQSLWAKLRDDAGAGGGPGLGAPAARTRAGLRQRTPGRPRRMKVHSNRAWLFVLPVLISVAFSAILPLMTIVNYSVQDILGPTQKVFVGAEWFKQVCATAICTARWDVSWCSRWRCWPSRSRWASPSRWPCRRQAGERR